MRLPPRIVGTLLLVTACAGTRGAHAASRLPAATAVIVDPHDGKNVFAPSNFGLLVSRDAGETWRWIGHRGIGLGDADEPSWIVTPKGTLVGATPRAVVASSDGGCTFTPTANGAAAIAVRTNGDVVLVTSDGDAKLHDNHLLVSSDDGKTFAPAGGPIDPTLGVDSVAVAVSDPARIYVVGRRGDADAASGGLLVSYDGGATWSSRKLDLLAGETPIVAGVDPANADRVYVRTSGVGTRARLVVSDDAGKTWKKIFESTSDALGFALAPDGKRVFVGTPEGVSSSPEGAFAFTKGSSIAAHCLASTGATLWACSNERSGFTLGTSRSSGRSFDPKLHLDDIKGPLECPGASAVAKASAADWPKQRAALGLADPADAPRAPTSGGGPALRGRAERTGRTVNTRAAVFGIAAFGLAAYTILKRLRRRP